MGSSLAYHLAAHTGFKGRVLVVEKDPSYAKAASSLSLSSVRQQFSSPVNIRVGLYGAQFLRKAAESLDVEGDRPNIALNEIGYLYLATHAGAATLRANHALQIREGADVELLDPPKLKAEFPFLAADDLALASLGRSGEGWFDGYALTQAFRRKARSLGIVYRTGEATAVRREGGRVVELKLADGTSVACGALVNAAGASGAARLCAAIGVEIPVHSRKRCVYAFESKPHFLNCPLVIDPSGVYFRADTQGYLCGFAPPEAEDVDSDDFEVDFAAFDDFVWPILARRAPSFESLRRGRAWAGHYDLNTFDHNAIVGRLPGLANVYVASGFSGHGIQQSPAVGRGLAELIVDGGYRSLDLGDFSYDRIPAGNPLREANVI